MSEVLRQKILNNLSSIFVKETGLEIHQAQRELLEDVASEILRKNPHYVEQFETQELTFADKQAYFTRQVIAASASQLTAILASILQEETGVEINKPEQDLILGIANEMLRKDPEFVQQLNQKTLTFADKREYFKKNLLAATAVAMFIEMMELQKDARALLKKYVDPSTSKDDKMLIKEKLRNVMSRLNRLDRNPDRQSKMNDLLNQEDFIDKLIQMQKDLQELEKNPESKTPTLEESKALNDTLQSMFDQNLENTLRNLYGCDPRIAGAIAFPVMCVIGDYVGIPDQFAAISSAANIHRLSGDLDAAGIDEHMVRAEKAMKNLETLTRLSDPAFNDMLENTDEMNDKLFNTTHHAPRFTLE